MELNRRIGLYFGSFNPPHNAHLEVMKKCLTLLDEVWVIVSPQNPYKTNLISQNMRLYMVNQIISGIDRLSASDIEFDMEKPSYTYKTMDKIRGLYPDIDFYLIFGSDVYNDIPNWVGGDKVLENDFIVIRRNGDSIKNGISKSKIDIDMDIKISSTIIRELVSSGGDISELVPESIISDIIKVYSE